MNTGRALSVGQRLQRERTRLDWSQERLAEAVGTTARSINRWEHNKAVPQQHYREQLCRIFQQHAGTLFGADDILSGNVAERSYIWNVPLPRNPFFTGREAILTRLSETFQRRGSVTSLTQAQALCGLGGVGKTQTVLEYAYRHANDYQVVLWLRANSREVLLDEFAALATLLEVPELPHQEPRHTVQAIRRWLNEHAQWLLILDNVEDPLLIQDLFPTHPGGHILLTTRSPVTGAVSRAIDLPPMKPEEGMLFLLRRAKRIEPGATVEDAPLEERQMAEQITRLVDGLPLALDQAGGYIEETGCSLSTYLQHYQRSCSVLLARRNRSGTDHPHSVHATFLLCYKQVEQADPAAAALLRLCAFLYPEAIPEEMIRGGASELGPILQPVANDPIRFDEALAALRLCSLVYRDPQSRTFTVHRLVQEVVKEGMDENAQRQWAERAVRAVNAAFPDADQWEMWQHCQRCLPHAYSCALLIDKWNIALPQAARLVYQLAYYSLELAMYPQAESLYRQVLDIRERIYGTLHPDVAECLNDLAVLYYRLGKYDQAELLYLQALAMREQTQEPTHPELVHTQCNLAQLYLIQGKYGQAEPLLQRALAVREQVLGSKHPHVAESLTLLANLYCSQEKYAQAEQLYQQSLAIREQVLGPEHPHVASSLNNWARLYHYQGKYTRAEPLLQRALIIREQALGPDHPQVALCLNNLAELYDVQDKYIQAEAFYRRALLIWEKALGSDHLQVAECSKRYADVLRKLKEMRHEPDVNRSFAATNR